MLTEGKVKLSNFMVQYTCYSKSFYANVRVSSAQNAVDYIRKIHPNSYVVEVWKVVNNWK